MIWIFVVWLKSAIAEDNSFLANSLINKLGLFDEFKVKFHALDWEDLLSQLNNDSNIDVILMDIQMLNLDGIKATEAVSKLFPQIKVIMLNVLDTERCILRPFTLDDVEDSYLINLDEDITRYTNVGGVKTRQQMHEIILNNLLGD